jgi:hypothetical protein
MKSLNFKRKEDSYLRYFDETQKRAVKKPFNWDRLIYIVLLLITLFFVGKFLVKRYLYIEGNGQVLFESVDIRHTDDIRIYKFFKKEGDDVHVGDTLFTYFLDEDVFGNGGGGGGNSVSISDANGEDYSWIEREIYALRKNIDLNNVKISDNNKLLAIYKNDLERVRNEVILDAVSHTNLENLEYQITRIESDNNLLAEQNRIFRKQIGYLLDLIKEGDDKERIAINQSGHVMLTGAENDSTFKIFTSPIEGSITHIEKQPFEVALKTEVILSIHQPNFVHIKGFFDQEDLRYLREGDVVDIVFADGTTSIGIVDRFYSATYILPEEFQKKFEPTTRTLAADILPITPDDLEKWKKYYKLSVKITKRTF